MSLNLIWDQGKGIVAQLKVGPMMPFRRKNLCIGLDRLQII
jgi:hypothetical protein